MLSDRVRLSGNFLQKPALKVDPTLSKKADLVSLNFLPSSSTLKARINKKYALVEGAFKMYDQAFLGPII